MQISMLTYKQTQPPLCIPPRSLTMNLYGLRWPKQKAVVVKGATGMGKSRLSIDVATKFPAEIVNSDKIRVDEGLDITTNKITEEEKCGVPHHLGIVNPNADFSASNFRDMATLPIESIHRRGCLPIIVGGSNSYIEAPVGDQHSKFRHRYDCIFLWVDVSRTVLNSFISKWVDKMMEEVGEMFEPNADYGRRIRRAIGVPKLHPYFQTEDEEARAGVLEEAVHEIKTNTCKLASRQLEKIHRQLEVSRLRRPKQKVVVVMGATGTGKSRLSIDVATKFPAEIVNSDKMQVYEGLDITTNKITEEEKCGVPHHLLGIVNPNADFSASNFRDMATLSIESIHSRGRLPIIVGGSNSYIEALVGDEYSKFRHRYDCIFLWVDVSWPVLNSFVSKRVDKMMEKGMVEEVGEIFDSNADYGRGIRRAIGVPELHRYFQAEDEEARARALEDAVHEIKVNTCKLASRQLEKIHRLKNLRKWKIHRLDATEAFLKRGREADEAWEKLVARPSTTMVAQFLYSVGANTASTQYSPREPHHGCFCSAVAEAEGGGGNEGDGDGEVAAFHRCGHQVPG